MNTNPEFSIEAFQAGDSRVFAYVYELHRSGLLALTAFLTGNEQAGKDIVQDTFIKLWVIRAEFNSLQNIEAFLRITARNACYDYRRSQKVAINNKPALIEFLGRAGEMSDAEKERSEIELLALRIFAEEAPPEVKYYQENNVSGKEAGMLFGIHDRKLRRKTRQFFRLIRQKLGLE